MSPRRSTLPICSGASSPASLIITPFLARIEPNVPLWYVPRSHRTSPGQLANVSSDERRLVDMHEMMDNHVLQDLSLSMLDCKWVPYRQHSSLKNACQLSQRSRTHRLPLRGCTYQVEVVMLCVFEVLAALMSSCAARAARSICKSASRGRCRRFRCSRLIATRARRGRRSQDARRSFSDSG